MKANFNFRYRKTKANFDFRYRKLVFSESLEIFTQFHSVLLYFICYIDRKK